MFRGGPVAHAESLPPRTPGPSHLCPLSTDGTMKGYTVRHTFISKAVRRELDALASRLNKARPVTIGYPGAVDFDYTPLSSFFAHHLLNNIGDPTTDGTGANHTKAMEREVVSVVADLLRAPRDNRWGYVTTGASEGNLYALYLARRRFPDAIVYHSTAAHYSVPKAVDLLAMASVPVRTNEFGEMDYHDLRHAMRLRRDRPAVVVASVGTTMSEAVDDVGHITAVLDELGVERRFIHADAALAGLPLALLGQATAHPRFDFADGADSMIISGHKFIGSPLPCGVVVVKGLPRTDAGVSVPYIGCADTTIAGSRSGHASLLLWYALRRYGVDGLRRRAEQCRRLAAYTLSRLDELAWDAYRHEHAFTVMLRTPPPPVTAGWVLASHDGWSHIVCMPGITRSQIDAFIHDLRAATRTEHRAARLPSRWGRPSARQPSPPSMPAMNLSPRRPGESTLVRSAEISHLLKGEV